MATAGDLRSRPDALAGLLAELVSEPRLDRVLAKIACHAKAAVGAAEVVLLLEEENGLRCSPGCTLPDPGRRRLEEWAASEPEAVTVTLPEPGLDDPGAPLSGLATNSGKSLQSLIAVPLRYGERRLGILATLGEAPGSLGPAALVTLEAYAVQAAIALTNARLFEAQEALAKRDPLTGLLNHREFHETVSHELSEGRRTGAPVSVVLLDLDRFKQINDTAGHGAGDRVLRAVASALAGVCRVDDSAFRVGGDEFALVLPRTGLSGASAAAERAVDAVMALSPRVGTSYGVAGWPAHGPTKDALLTHADAGLYEMKSLRRARGAHPRAAADSIRWAQRERLAVASRLSTKLAHAQDPEEVARTTVEELHHSFDYYLAVLQRLDPDGVLRVVAAAGPLADGLSDYLELEQRVEQGVNGRVARTGEPALVPDTRLDPDYIRRDSREGTGSELSLPVRLKGRVWGVLNLEQMATDAFTDEDLLLADTAAAQAGAALHRCALVEELENAFMTTLGVLSDAVETKDSYTAEHADEVAVLAGSVAERLGMAGDDLRAVRYAALLHDVGKVGVRSELLGKPSKLDPAEFEEIKRHSLIGARMLSKIPFFTDVVPLVRGTHERWDGGGYPDALAGEAIPLGARVIAACDAFHAMTSDRPYRAALPARTALDELRSCAHTQFDPRVVAAVEDELG